MAAQALQSKDTRIAQLEELLERAARTETKLQAQTEEAKQKLATVVSRENDMSLATEKAIHLQTQAEHKLFLLRNGTKEAAARIQGLEAEMETKDATISELETKLSEQEVRLGHLQHQIATAKEGASRVQSDLAARTAENDIAKAKLKELESTIKSKDEALVREQSERHKLCIKCDELQGRALS